MNKICLHIGFHKTATTFLQQKVFLNLTNTKFIASFNNNKTIYELLGQKFNTLHKNILISKESFSGTLNLNEDKKLKFSIANKIKNKFPEAKIIVTIREQKAWVLSYYLYCLKYFNLHNSINKIISSNQKFFFEKLSYFELINSYINMFGKDNVLVIPIEMLRKERNETFKKIEKFTGEKILQNNLNYSSINSSNYNNIYVNCMIVASKFVNFIVFFLYHLKICKSKSKPKMYFSFIEKIINFFLKQKIIKLQLILIIL